MLHDELGGVVLPPPSPLPVPPPDPLPPPPTPTFAGKSSSGYSFSVPFGMRTGGELPSDRKLSTFASSVTNTNGHLATRNPLRADWGSPVGSSQISKMCPRFISSSHDEPSPARRCCSSVSLLRLML